MPCTETRCLSAMLQLGLSILPSFPPLHLPLFLLTSSLLPFSVSPPFLPPSLLRLSSLPPSFPSPSLLPSSLLPFSVSPSFLPPSLLRLSSLPPSFPSPSLLPPYSISPFLPPSLLLPSFLPPSFLLLPPSLLFSLMLKYQFETKVKDQMEAFKEVSTRCQCKFSDITLPVSAIQMCMFQCHTRTVFVFIVGVL